MERFQDKMDKIFDCKLTEEVMAIVENEIQEGFVSDRIMPLIAKNKDKILNYADGFFKKKFGADYKEKGKAAFAELGQDVKQKVDELISKFMEIIKQMMAQKEGIVQKEDVVREDLSPAELVTIMGVLVTLGPVAAYYAFSKLYNLLTDMAPGSKPQAPQAKKAAAAAPGNKDMLAKMEQERDARRAEKAAEQRAKASDMSRDELAKKNVLGMKKKQ